MGIFRRRHSPPPAVRSRLHGGHDDLEVVGEASYQNALWSLCGGSPGDRVRHGVIAVLVPEPENPHDRNAIAVCVEGEAVGYLRRETAAVYISPLRRLMATSGAHVALHGVIVGGGQREDGPGRLGVWLHHNAADFGVAPKPVAPVRVRGEEGAMRTGFSEAWRTDLADDSYDLTWFSTLPEADRPAIAMLRDLLAQERDPLDRHFQFAELETRLYRARDLYETALDEFDGVCRRHDAEMDVIRRAFIAKWGTVPVLATYRQMAIRQQKRKDWNACAWWCERGLELYGTDAAREDVVEDLLKRRNRARAKIEEQARVGSVAGTSGRVARRSR